MSRKTTNRTALLAAGIFMAIAPSMYAQEPNPDSLKQDQADQARERAIRTQDDRVLRDLIDQIHRLEAERNGINSQVMADERAWSGAQARYSADQKNHASNDQLEKDRQAVELARAAKERDIQRRAELDQKIAQLKEQFAARNAQRNKDTSELKSEEAEIARDRRNGNQDNRNLADLNRQIRQVEAERNALNTEINNDRNAANQAEAKYAADQKNHAGNPQLEQDRLALQRASEIHKRDMQRAQELDRRIAQLRAELSKR
jgi:chromosome segregation ATPase